MSGPIQQDEDGLLWLFIYRPASTWKEGWASARITNGEVRSRDLNHERLFNTYVEVIDPAKGRVVTNHTIKGYVFEALPNRRVALYKIDDNGIPRVDIATLVLRGR